MFRDWGIHTLHFKRFYASINFVIVSSRFMKKQFEKPDLNGAIEERSLLTAIALLPKTFRTAILLREIERLSYQEIADLTGVSFSLVRSRIAKARAILTLNVK